MNRLSKVRRAQILSMLVEGNSLRATSRMAGCSINTVSKLLVDVGAACSEFQDRMLRDLPCKVVECDEIWSFCYAKAKNVPEEHKDEFGYGDVWTWVALCADTKLAVTWLVGERTTKDGLAFMADLKRRTPERIQLSTDGHQAYRGSVPYVFECECNSDLSKVSTSYVERQNLTMRMGMRRFTRLTNGFSKKIESHVAAVAIHFMHYNFGRPHKTLANPYPCTPAMAAGVADHVWTPAEIAELAA